MKEDTDDTSARAPVLHQRRALPGPLASLVALACAAPARAQTAPEGGPQTITVTATKRQFGVDLFERMRRHLAAR